MSRRTERVASLIRSIVADAMQSRLSDPRIEPLTSITRVEVSADFSVARVHVSVLAPEPRRKLSVEALSHAAGKLRSLVARGLTLRQAPQLVFQLDESLQHGFETVQQIDRLMAELEENNSSGAAAECAQPAAGRNARADAEPGVDRGDVDPGLEDQ